MVFHLFKFYTNSFLKTRKVRIIWKDLAAIVSGGWVYGYRTFLREHQKAVFFSEKENSALLGHTCLTNHTIEWDDSNYHHLLTLPPAPLFGSLTYQLHPRSLKSWWWRLSTWGLFTPRQEKGQLICEHIKWPLVTTIRLLMKAQDRTVGNFGFMNCNFSVTFIKSLNQSRHQTMGDRPVRFYAVHQRRDFLQSVIILRR